MMLKKIISKHQYAFFVLMAILAILSLSWNGSKNIAVTQEKESTNKTSQENSNRLDLVKKRGYLICGVSGELPGFSYLNQDGQYAGLDVDVCRAVAAALFDDPTKVEFRNISVAERFDVLKSGEIDLLSRNTTQTFSRDTDANLEFTPPTFYDAQGVMVNQASNIKTIAELKGKSICVAENTTSYDNLKDYMRSQGVNYRPVIYADGKSLFDAYEHNRCQAVTGDISFLVARRVLLANPQEHQIISEVIAQEPLAPALIHNDSQWFDAVKWITYALIQAEELGISSENLSTYQYSNDFEVRRFLGIDGDLGSEMGLPNDFTAKIIKHVGNYGEIYERNIGRPFGLARGRNALWKDRGLMYSPPFK